MEFEWDELKNQENIKSRGIDFSLANNIFDGEHITFEDDRENYGEPRFISIGFLVGRMMVVVHTRRGNKTRIISMRKANVREQKTYKERFGTD